ncbi:hypothetical protein PAXRUDRAFT_174823 [Paxillus rubicundulus Ve08.2h10]|uniref:Uncharacterized protein n=1 Tax=Paxillus rubicundulus Ve08.2h10 TaxID=930991 RepID=A0A0D0DBW6_9AGAM|nr:hypothetical protein PAXRUDRAFT_174823 [Paxillus rubicundulus Ve08.2h10]
MYQEIQPTPSTYPKVRWWKQSQFDEFVLSPEGTVAKLGSVPYLETEDGEAVSNKSLKVICQTLCGAWTKLANHGKAPQTWWTLSASGSELFTLLMEAAHPLFKLAEDSWKLKTLTTYPYPSWCATHLNDNCQLLPKGKKAVKEEDDENTVPTGGNLKRKGSNSHPKGFGKCFKGV